MNPQDSNPHSKVSAVQTFNIQHRELSMTSRTRTCADDPRWKGVSCSFGGLKFKTKMVHIGLQDLNLRP
jgi:hypothetical protein